MMIITVGWTCLLIVSIKADRPNDTQQCMDYMNDGIPSDAVPSWPLVIQGHTATITGKMEACSDNLVLVYDLEAQDIGCLPGFLPYVNMAVRTKGIRTVSHACEWKAMDFVKYETVDLGDEPVLLIQLLFKPKESRMLNVYVKIPVFVAQNEEQINHGLDEYLRLQREPDGEQQDTLTLEWIQNAPFPVRLHYCCTELKPLYSPRIDQWYDFYAICHYVSKETMKHVFEEFGWMQPNNVSVPS